MSWRAFGTLNIALITIVKIDAIFENGINVAILAVKLIHAPVTFTTGLYDDA